MSSIGILIPLFTLIAIIFGIITNAFDIKDRFLKWKIDRRSAKFKKKFIADNPDFEFKIGHVSNSPAGKCILTVQFLNLSNAVKFIEPISYNYEFKNNMNQYEPPTLVMDHQEWPKRLEHGQRFAFSVDFNSMLNNGIFRYWKKQVQVFAACKSTTGDLLRSNSIDFDILAKNITPLGENNKKLAFNLSKKYKSNLRNVEASLWQLQIFNRITSHIVTQLEKENIPILQHLIQDFGLVLVERNNIYEMYKELERKKIPATEIEKYLQNLTPQRT